MENPAIERRGAVGVTASGRSLTGYVATFGTEARIGGFTESIAPGAFTATLRGDSAARSAFYQRAIEDGWMTIAEVRQLENLPKIASKFPAAKPPKEVSNVA